MKIKETILAPIAVLTSYILYALCFRFPWVQDALRASGDYSLLSGIVLELLILLLPALFYAKAKGQGYSAELGFAALRPSATVFGLSLTVVALCATVLIACGMSSLGFGKYLLTDAYSLRIADSGQSVFLRCVSAALIPAVGEELLFRGILITEYKRSGVAIAVGFSSLLFALARFDAVLIPTSLITGIIFALIYYVSGSLPITVGCRLCFNLLTFYFEDAAWTLILKRSNFFFLMSFTAIVLLLCAVLALSEAQRLYYIRGIDGEATPIGWKQKDKFATRLIQASLSPTFIACIGVFIGVIIYG